ncbi:hypothetical protein G8764_16780 [Pseudomaricurvus alcaniphilus]|uniref:hypothetical protein n=1 Tax=Pseudomaricurvus alcaniphilus TaxID=1166482 RepID=UPI00140890BF|nr:hypothetical protein [Pseudomaricurvus alcaniphilus]NHN38966.1 hypothetical protein [Pseudomaricurvus alcaniphilus]
MSTKRFTLHIPTIRKRIEQQIDGQIMNLNDALGAVFNRASRITAGSCHEVEYGSIEIYQDCIYEDTIGKHIDIINLLDSELEYSDFQITIEEETNGKTRLLNRLTNEKIKKQEEKTTALRLCNFGLIEITKAQKGEHTELILASNSNSDSDVNPRFIYFTTQSFYRWMSHRKPLTNPPKEFKDRFIDILATSTMNIQIDKTKGITDSNDKSTWDKVTIYLQAKNRIGYQIENNPIQTKHMMDIGLLNKKANTPNTQYTILLGLSRGMRYPTKALPKNNEKTAISKLRRSLEALTGIRDDPFKNFDDDQGWKPLFKLLDRTHSADERAKERAIHIPFDDSFSDSTADFDDEDDAAGEFLKQ